jgi:hypothetical protein
VTKRFSVSGLGLLLSESRFPKLLKIVKVEINLERFLETVGLRVKQALRRPE